MLELDEREVERHRLLAEQARADEADLWELAGIGAGALVAAAGLGNVTVTEARADRTGLEAGSLDAVMLRHVLAHNGGAEDAIVAHLATLVHPGAACTWWTPTGPPSGPCPSTPT